MPVVEFLQFTLSGVSFGMIYAAVALSLVLIWRGTRLLNYAQGGMAMITTYIAIEVIYHTGSYWAGFVVALVAGVMLGAVCQLTIIRAAEARGRVQRHDRPAVRHPGGAGAHRGLGAGRPARRAGRRARLAVDLPVPEQHGHHLRVRLHRGGDRRPGQPGRRGDRRA